MNLQRLRQDHLHAAAGLEQIKAIGMTIVLAIVGTMVMPSS